MEQPQQKKYYGTLSILFVLVIVVVLGAVLIFSQKTTPTSGIQTPTQDTQTIVGVEVPTSSPVIVSGGELDITKTLKPCVISGCSRQLCGEEEMMTTCEFREVYQCYAQARCERNSLGTCGWVVDSALRSCIDAYQ